MFEERLCAFCGGGGVDPFGVMSHLSSCCVCGGSGRVLAPTPHVPCAHCRGTGSIKRLTCTVCGGKGCVLAPAEPGAPCPGCGGSGDDASIWAMACLTCLGRGQVAKGQVARRGDEA